MVEKAVQTLHVDRSRQRRGSTASQEQEQRWERRRPQRTRGESFQSRKGTGPSSKHTERQRWKAKIKCPVIDPKVNSLDCFNSLKTLFGMFRGFYMSTDPFLNVFCIEVKSGPGMPSAPHETRQQNNENRPTPPRRRQGRFVKQWHIRIIIFFLDLNSPLKKITEDLYLCF